MRRLAHRAERSGAEFLLPGVDVGADVSEAMANLNLHFREIEGDCGRIGRRARQIAAANQGSRYGVARTAQMLAAAASKTPAPIETN